MPDRLGARFRLRMTLGHPPELLCPHCGEWWEISPEFWRLNEWSMCLACGRERARLYAALRLRDDMGYRDRKAEASRRYRNWLKATHPEYITAYDRERRARNREKARQRRARA